MTTPEQMSAALVDAQHRRAPISAFTRVNPFLSVETAYQAQSMVVEHHVRSGDRVVGAKLGLTSKVKRLALGIDEPVYGRLTTSMLLVGEQVRLNELISPRAEPELAFLLGKPLRGEVSVTEVMNAVSVVLPAIEIVDSRFAGPIRHSDSIADNAGAALFAIGAHGRRPRDLVDLSVLGCVFRHRGGIDTATCGAVMGHPAVAISWLVRALARRNEQLDEGSIVLSGGLTGSVRLHPADTVTVEFDGLNPLWVSCS
jgi:2-oxo-3-hexenedioate decarboxylase